MKNLFKSLAIAAVVALPLTAEAQIDNSVDVFLTGTTRRATTGTGFGDILGGGFSATFTADFGGTIGERTFTEWLVWCIDPSRGITQGSTTSKSLFSLADFAASNFGPAAPSVYDPNQADMNRIASLVTALEDDWANEALRADRQGGIWANFMGTTPPAGFEGNSEFDGSQYYVLWGNEGVTQTLITHIPDRFLVPEPSSIAMIGLGFVGLVAARRRRNA